MIELFIGQLGVFFTTIVYGSFFELALHKYVLHSHFPFLMYNYVEHQHIHHVIFLSDGSFQAMPGDKRRDTISLHWRNYIYLPLVHLPLFAAVEFLSGIPWMITGTIAIVLYIAAFNFVHNHFHAPHGRFFEKWALFRWLRQHHRLHHETNFKNLNVVLPLADLCLGTYRRK